MIKNFQKFIMLIIIYLMLAQPIIFQALIAAFLKIMKIIPWGYLQIIKSKFWISKFKLLGLLYATFTALLGYTPDSDEWKVMAMSAYKNNCIEIKKIKKLYKLKRNGKLELDQKYFGINHLGNNNYLITKDLMDLFKIKKFSIAQHRI